MKSYAHTPRRIDSRNIIIMKTRIVIKYGIMKNGLRSKDEQCREPFSSQGWSNGCDEIIFIFIWIITNNELLKRKTKQISFSIKHDLYLFFSQIR